MRTRTIAFWRLFLCAVVSTAASGVELDPTPQNPSHVASAANASPSKVLLPEQAARLVGDALSWRSDAGATEKRDEKTVANGIYMDGSFGFQTSGSNVTLTVDRINNDSSTRTTGTLRLELWATTTRPSRGVGFSGFKLATASTLSGLAPRTFYSSVVRTSSFSEPPSGTYWMVLVLSEFDSVNCSASDHFCIQDSGIFTNQQTFGTQAPGLLTILSRAADQCYENYPSGAYDIVQQISPGVFQSFPGGTTCASLGLPFFAGVLVTDSTIRVYTSTSASAQFLCATGLLANCSVAPPSGPSYTDLWWNPLESGWGVSITHHPSGVIFLAWYTYDANGNSKWYVASECRVTATGCSGTLYEANGPPLGSTYNSNAVFVRAVGSVTLRFSGPTSGSMTYTVNGISGTKVITRQSF